MRDMMVNLDFKHCTRSICKVRIDENDIIESSDKIHFRFPKAKTYSFNSIRSLGTRIWTLIPDDLKKIGSLHIFKEKVKTFQFKDCLCKICKDYGKGVGFIN